VASFLVALLFYGFALLLFTFIRQYPVQGKFMGVLAAVAGGYLAARIAGRERRPVLHAAVPAAIFLLPVGATWDIPLNAGGWRIVLGLLAAPVFLPAAALLGASLARPRTGLKAQSSV
jgi:hypothetical protein